MATTEESVLEWVVEGEEKQVVVRDGSESITQHALQLLPLHADESTSRAKAKPHAHFHQLSARRRPGKHSKDKAGKASAEGPSRPRVLCATVNSVEEERAAPWAEMDRLLADRAGLQSFKAFVADDEAGLHCLYFYLACKYFSTISSSLLHDTASLICDSFLGPDAPYPIRVSWTTANRALASVRSATSVHFQPALDEAVFLLARHFADFLASPQYAGLSDATRFGHRRPITVDLHEEVKAFLTLPTAPSSPRRAKSRSRRSTTSVPAWRSKSKVVSRLRSKKREGAPSKSLFTPFRHGHATKKDRDRAVLSRGGAVLRLSCHSWRIHQSAEEDHATTAVIRYYDKLARTGAVSSTLLLARRDWSLRRGVAWKPPNTRPTKLLHTLRDITDVASTRHPVLVHGLESGVLLTAYQDGCIAIVSSRFDTGNVFSAILDRTIAAKLAEKQYGVLASAVCISDGVVVFTLTHSSVIGVAVLHDISHLRGSDQGDLALSGSARTHADAAQGGVQRAVRFVSFHKSAVDRPGGLLSVHRTLVLQWWSAPSERDDNVCVYVLPDSQQLVHLRHLTVPHLIHSLIMSKLDPKTVFLLQRKETPQRGFRYFFSRFSMRHSEDVPSSPRSQPSRPVLEQHQSITLNLTSAVVVAAVSFDDTRAVVVTQQGHVHLINLNSNTSTLSVLPMAYATDSPAHDPVCVAWHPSSAYFAVVSRRGVVALFDRALNPLNIVLNTEDATPLPYLDLSLLDITFSGAAGAHWLPAPHTPSATTTAPPPSTTATTTATVPAATASSAAMGTPRPSHGAPVLYDSCELVLLLSGGPPAVLRFESAAAFEGTGDSVLAGLCINHVRSGNTQRAIRLAKEMEWTASQESCFHVLNTIFDELLRLPFSDERCDKALAAIPRFAWEQTAVDALGLQSAKLHIDALLWRLFEHMMLHGSLLRALLLATRTASPPMCRALVAATEHARTATEVVVHAVAQRAQHTTAGQLVPAPESTV